jgi:hypothetical protein
MADWEDAPARRSTKGGWEDAPVAKNTWEDAPAPVAKAEPVPEDGYADPMGSGFGAAIKSVAATRDPKTYTGSVFDTQPFNPQFDPREAARLSRRDYAEESTKPPRRAPPYMTESPEYVGRDRTVGETAIDLTAAVSKGTTGFFKGILNNLPGDPGTELFGGMEQRAERLTSPITKGSEIARQGKIARAQELEGEIGAARATYQSMFTPAGMQVIAQGGGSLIPSIGLSVAGLGAKAVAAANALSNAGDAAVQSAEQLKKIAPEQWSKNEVYLSLREQGLSHRDAVNMLAPIYAIPAQAAGAATGYLSGRTGLEKALTSGAAKGMGAAAGRFGAELLGEEVESLAPQFVGNLVGSTLDNKITPTQGLGQTAVETAFGTLPGAGLAALPSSSERLDTLNKFAQKNGFTDVQDMIRKVTPTIGRKAIEDQLIDAIDAENERFEGRRTPRSEIEEDYQVVDTYLDEVEAKRTAADVKARRQKEADLAEVERENQLAEEYRNAPPVAEDTYEGPEVPDDTFTFKPLEETPAETPAVTAAPEAVPVLIGLQDAAFRNKAPKDTELGKWLASNGLIATQKGKTNVTPLGQKLLDQLNPTGIGAQSLTIEEANSLVKEFTHFNRPSVKEEVSAPAQPEPVVEQEVKQAPAAATPITFVKEKRTKDEYGNTATDVELSDGNKHKIQRLNSTESMGLPGWHDTSATPTTGSYLGNTKAEAVKELLRRAEERRTAPTTSTEDTWATEGPANPEIIEPTTPTDAADSVTPTPEVDAPYYGTEEINVLGSKIKETAEKIASDFMVGDDVRIGNIPGTVVGLEGDYVKVRPDNAVSAKAYQRVPKRNVTFVSRPNTASTSAASKSADQDKKFGSEQGKLNADMGGLIQLLGANMYASSIADVAVKELLQNAFDAVKGAISNKKAPSLYKTGEITISFDRDNRTITIADNARGMTPEIVRDAFFTVAGSDKSDLDPSERSGGLGLAKMGFMLGSERLILDTVRDGVRVRVDTSAKDIADSKFQIVKTPAPKGEHGTSVTVKIPEYYVDPKTGDQKNIYYSDNASYYEALGKPLIGPVQVTIKKSGTLGNKSEILPVGVNFPEHEYQPLRVNFGWGSADVFFGKTRKEGYGIKHQVLSSGVYQFDTAFMMSQTEKVPFDIIVNVKPNVEAKHPDYPFENSRERFKGRLKEDIDSLSTYLAQIARGHEAADMKENFKNIVSMPRVDLGSDVAEASKKLQKSFDKRGSREGTGELPPLPREVQITGTRVIDTSSGKTIADRAKAAEKQTKGTFGAETAAPTRSEFMTKMDQDPSLPIYHNNTNVDLLEVGRQYGNPEVFFAELGTLLVEMKEALANSGIYGYDVLKPENLFFAGISVDKKYGGVHIKLPYKAVMLNPFYSFGARTLFGVRQQLLNTMIHEIAHTGDMDHGVGHNTQMIKVEQFLADQGLYDYFRDAILDVLARHESAFTAMREAYGQSTTQNTAKSLEDYGSKSASASNGGDGDGSSYELGSVPARGGQGGDGDLRAAAPVNPLVGVRRSTAPEGWAVADTSVRVKNSLHPSVTDAINNNDVTGALRALAQNTSGFYSELATRLAELGLPSSIGFKRGRDLVRRAIDHKTSQQQTRLFAYISRMYPDLYNKYFQNYDRSENLEQVAEGLREFDKPKYNKGPVATEYGDVAYTFNKTMPGLTAPGAFYPAFDAIDLNPHPHFGTSNRVFLHEVVHAATEYLLYGGAPLTDRQQLAVASLYEMYDYAQTKLAPGEYGFTNISEFIAEALTNKGFQDKLKTVHYKQEKSSLLNSFIRIVMRMFGKDNLASAAMSEANELFSAFRPQNIVAIGPRFSKRVRGPISKPDTWRTAESLNTSISETVKDAAIGRMSIADAVKDVSGAMWSAGGWAVRKSMLPILPLRVLKDLTRTKFPQIAGSVDIVEKMTTFRGKKLKISEDIVQEWGPLQAKYPKQSALMSRIMIEATIRGRDPADGVPTGAAPDALDNAWNALRPEFQKIYANVRDFYANSVNEMVQEMKKRAMSLPKAERQAMIRKINDQFGPGKLVAPYFPLRRFGDFWMQVGKGNFKEFYSFESPVSRFLAFQKRKRQLSKGNALQKGLVETMRMGNGISELYSSNVATTQVLKDVTELVDGLSVARTAPTAAEYSRIEKRLQKELGRLPTKTEVEDSHFVKRLQGELNDSLNQLIYLLLPQQSMRKMFINRRAIQGASSDMLRVFAYTAVHSAYQQARFKYAESFINNINNAKDYIDEFANPERAAVYRDYVHEVEKRTSTVLGVEDKSPMAQFVGGVTSTTFFFMLTAPASAILNVIGATAVTMPYIGARYGYAKTNALMLKNLAKYVGTTPKRSLLPLAKADFANVSFPSIVEGGQLPPLLQRAADRFVSDGDINISMTNDIFDLGDRPSDLYTGRTNAVKKVLAGLFHQAERLNREISLLTTFELAYEKYNGADKKDLRGVVERVNGAPVKYTADEAFEIAIGEARDIAGLTLGDFTRQMKGRAFTVPTINLLTQFKQYAITATYAILRNFYLTVGAPFSKTEINELREQLVKDNLPQNIIDQRVQEADQLRKEIYREGRRRLAGILGMTFLYGGIAAMPFFSLGLGTLIKAAFSGDDDDDEFFDWENWFYNYMVTEVGGATGAMFAKMGMSEKGAKELGEKAGAAMARGPVGAITGASLSDRVSLDLKNLWYREGKYSPDMRESVQEAVIANMGPSAGLGMNLAGAWQLASQGQYARAFETGMPSVVAKPVTAYRLGTEGATTRGGEVIGNLYPEQFTLWELSLQAIGFQPEKLAVAQKRAIQAKTYEQKVLDKKEALMNRIWLERDSSDGLESALDKAREFSVKYPEVAITPDSIAKSFETRSEAKAKAEAIGAKLNEKLLNRTRPMLGE